MLKILFVLLFFSPTMVYAEDRNSETAFSVSSGLHDKIVNEIRDRQAEIKIRELKRKKEAEKAKRRGSRHNIYNQ